MSDIAPNEQQPSRLPTRASLNAAIVAVVLVGLGDALLLGQMPGLGLLVFAALIAAGILIVNRRHLGPGHFVVLALTTALMLPLAKTVSIPGLLTAGLGLALLALTASRLLPPRLETMPRTLIRYGLLSPFRLLADAIKTLQNGLDRQLGKVLARSLIAWIVPVLFAAIFLWLFANANPIIDGILQQFDIDAALGLLDPVRIALWLLMAAVVWALLRPKLLHWRKRHKPAASAAPTTESWLFGRDAILRSLLVFNALFAIQTVLDLAYLWGGVTLPEGMSHADYAHRGAYPLIVTALLAAGFVLAAMRKNGPGESDVLIRRLVYAWIAQNVLLCISSILRLDLYVEVYSLTELRVAAGIWMGLVAMGLVLILARIVLRQSNAWLVATNLVALTAVLWACAIVDLSAFIARFNVEHSLEVSGEGLPLDAWYLVELGPSALPALDQFLDTATLAQDHRKVLHGYRGRIIDQMQQGTDWRSWTWRGQRQLDYLNAVPAIASPSRSGMY